MVLLLGLGVTAPPRVCAQSSEPNPEAGQPEVSDSEPADVIFETATVWERAVETSASAITVLDRSDIDELDVLTVSQLVSFAPGVFTTDSGSPAGLSAAQIRGGDPNFTLVLLDGVPLNDATDQFGGAVNLNTLPVSEVERVEILRGPISSFFGSAALGGAINIITRKGGQATPRYQVQAAGGNLSLFQGAASASTNSRRSASFVGVSWQEESGRIGEDAFEQLNAQGSYRHSFSRRAELTASGRITSWEGDDYPEGSGGPDLGSGDTRFSDHQEFSLDARLQVGPEERQHQITLRVYRQDVQRESPAIGFVVPESTEDTTYTRLQANWAYPVWQSDTARLSFGVAVDDESGENSSQYAGFLSGSYRLDRTTASGLLELTAESGPWLLELGGRLDVPEGFDPQFSPRLAAAYLFSENTRLRGSIARAFKLPSFFALGTPPALGGNPDLDPEIAVGADLGFEHQMSGPDLAFSVGLFYTRYKDLIDFLFDPAPMLVNRSQVDAWGTELWMKWRPSEKVSVDSNLTWQKVEDTETSEMLRNRPEWFGSMRLNWNPVRRLDWELDGRFVSERQDQQIPSTRTTVEGYVVLGTAIRWTFKPRWSLDARVENLSDREYETFIGFPGPARSGRIGLIYASGLGK